MPLAEDSTMRGFYPHPDTVVDPEAKTFKLWDLSLLATNLVNHPVKKQYNTFEYRF